jgi:hypothetical protein
VKITRSFVVTLILAVVIIAVIIVVLSHTSS